jgi:hypothetical protein
MAELKDMTGQRFGKLTVIRRGENYRTLARWICQCDCGKEKQIAGSSLRKGLSKSCGCGQGDGARRRKKPPQPKPVPPKGLKRQSKIKAEEFIGLRFGRLVITDFVGHDKWQSAIWRCLCDCGTETTSITHTLKQGKKRSCGCLHREHMQRQYGSNNPYWNPELSDEERQNRRATKDTAIWIRKVLERDDFTCQICSTRGGKLVAHHLDGWNWCTEKRHEICNGVTLCRNCHDAFHDIYGKGGNTMSQYQEFQQKYCAKLRRAHAS